MEAITNAMEKDQTGILIPSSTKTTIIAQENNY